MDMSEFVVRRFVLNTECRSVGVLFRLKTLYFLWSDVDNLEYRYLKYENPKYFSLAFSDQTPLLSISTPELFSKTDALSHGTPVSKENTSMSDYLNVSEK